MFACKDAASKHVNFGKKHRSHFEIVSLILEDARDKYVTRFSIANYANINYTQLKQYLRVLIKMRLIEVHIVNGRVFYKTSAEGINFLKQYRVLLNIILRLKEIKNDAHVAATYITEQDPQHSKLSQWR
ncbi:MAG: winged helix-turn-helix domain-containing protein [Candidatus Bathyarchaeia archaeon]